MSRYQCNVCQHIYDPAEGDSASEVVAGTEFSDLPDGWKCPVCGVGVVSFHEIVEEPVAG